MEELQKTLNYRFNNQILLKQAITHSSITSRLSGNYERLEFLGDRVLGVAVASMMYQTFSNEPEGNLSQRFMALVCKETVASKARELGLQNFIRSDGLDINNNDSVLSDVCEAIIGAIYIDAGAEVAIDFVKPHWQNMINTHISPPKDAKTSLQEIAHEKKLTPPVYSIISKSGSEHKPVFAVEVKIAGMEPQVGIGGNKKMAEQNAAEKMLITLGAENDK